MVFFRMTAHTAAAPKTPPLHMGDMLVLAILFFGAAIYSSTQWFWDIQSARVAAAEAVAFDEGSHRSTIIYELCSLACVWLYLRWRRFDWKNLDFSMNRKTLWWTLVFIISAGLVADIFHYLNHYLTSIITGAEPTYAQDNVSESAQRINAWLLVVSALNGFFEELFFIGLIYTVRQNHLRWTLVFGLIVRFAFHTYQGLDSALIITTLGIVFIFWRARVSQLMPFMLAHSVFDIFGLSLVGIFWGISDILEF